jgi:integrase
MRRRRYQNGCLLKERRKTGPAVWVFRYRDGHANRKEQIGTVEQFPTKSAAQKACQSLRKQINIGSVRPRNVADLIAHYTLKELSERSKKAHSTREMYGSYIKSWILQKWAGYALSDVRAIEVEEWLGTLPLANASKAKIRSIMSAIFNHAMRYEWTDRNPIALVRQSAKREKVPDVLTAEEIGALLAGLFGPCRMAVLLASCTGLRVSELLALKWQDIHFDAGEIRPERAIVDGHIGGLKTEASGRAVPLAVDLASALLDWRGVCPYNQDSDFVFGSPEMNGTQPYWPDSMLRKVIRPAAVKARISKRIGWHSFRRSLATLLQANGASVKATQDMLRHANSRLTLELYAQSVPEERRAAQAGILRAVVAGSAASVPKRSLINS